MSIIIAIAEKNRIIVKSDGRECDLQKNIISEKHPKIVKLNTHNTVIGFTGSTHSRAMVVNHLISLYGDKIDSPPQNIFDSARKYCIKKNISETLTMIVASTDNNTLFLKQFSTDYSYKEIDCLNNKLPVLALAGDIIIPFDSYNPDNPEQSMNDYIIETSKLTNTVNKNIYTEILII